MKKRQIIAGIVLLCLAVGGIAAFRLALMPPEEVGVDIHAIQTYRNIPGITEEEILKIEALKSERQSFSYAIAPSSEAFVLPDQTLTGFAVKFCALLSDLFGIPFVLEVQDWDTLKAGVDDQTYDFTGELTPTPERMRTYFMTHPIAARPLGIFTKRGGVEVQTENDLNHLRIGFFEGTITAQSILEVYHNLTFECIDVLNTEDANEKLEAGYIDAYIVDATDAYNYILYSFAQYQEFFPLVYTPVSMTSANPALEPVISAVSKYISAGGIDTLNELYREGSREYARFDLARSFTEEETAYIRALSDAGSRVRVALEHDNYPVCFYDERYHEFQGISVDVLNEIAELTGLVFETVTDRNTHWSDVLEMLRRGDVALVSELLYSKEREADFIWADEPYATARYALISRMDYPNLETNQVIRTKTGVVAGTAYEDLLNEWFPGHPNQYPHVSHYDVFDALESGEVDLVLASESILSFQINYRENPDYKANIVFHSPPEESSFGFNKDQHLLRSIISKAQSHINTGKIENHWKSRVYDYSARVARVRSRYLSVAAAVLLLMLAVMSVLFVKNVQTRNLYKSAVEKATEASKAKSIFLARMSHEIRTPMNTIVGISQMQLQKSGMHEDYSKAFEYIYDAGNTLLAIINDILDMSKIETGKMELSPIEYNLPGLINDVVTLNVMRIGSKPIELSLDINENLPLKVRGDELRLKEILTNLLSNAIKYTDEGSVKISVSHVPQDGGVTLRFTVEDTGHGIKTEDMPKLFTEFMRFDASTNHYIEGTGLGLSIAKNFVELMGGTIEAESEYGAGSKFTVTVEQELVSGEIIGKELSERFRNFTFKGDRRFQNIQIIHYPMPYGKVLVVDDVRSNLFVAEGLLLPYELQIETALSGYEAIKKIFVGHTYDIIFMDHMMPQMDGIETTRKLRESGYKGTIIALTANALLGNDVMFKQNGFDDFIPKPIDIRYLNAVLNQYIRDRYPEEAAKHKLTVKEGRRNSQPSALNQKLLKLFRIDAEEALAALGQSMTGGDMKLYTTKVHAMKSALANIGQNELSQVAAALENAGRTGDTAFISAHHDHFVTSLEALIRRLETAEPAAPPDAEPAEEDTAYLSEQLLIIRKACEDYDDAAVYAALDRLKEKPWKAETAAVLEEIHDLLFIDSNFESVEARILTLMKEE